MEAALIGPEGRITLGTTAFTIGRMPGNQLQMTDRQASSHHAEIRPDGQGYCIVDLGSTNGTFVNDQRLTSNTPRHLNSGDRVRIGETVFNYETISDAAVEPTVYAGSSEQGKQPAFEPTIAVPPPSYTNYNVNEQQGFQPPPPPASVYQSSYTPAASPLYPPSGSYSPPAMPAQQKRSRRGVWLTLGIVVAVLLLACVSFAAYAYANRSTPEKTLTTFCSDLKSGNYHDAYQQFSSGFQAQESEAKFTSGLVQAFTVAKLKDCTPSNVADDGTNATAIVTLLLTIPPNTSTTPIVDDDTKLVNQGGTWKIDHLRTKKQSS